MSLASHSHPVFPRLFHPMSAMLTMPLEVFARTDHRVQRSGEVGAVHGFQAHPEHASRAQPRTKLKSTSKPDAKLRSFSSQNPHQESEQTHRFVNGQMWPRAVAVLRTGCILTRGHPLQVNGGKRLEFISVAERQFTSVNSRFSMKED